MATTDSAHEETNKMIEEMEKKLREIYSEAQKDVSNKVNAYFRDFEAEDKKKRKQLVAGDITEAEYKAWVQQKTMTGEHWTALRRQIASEMTNVNKTAAAYVNGKLPDVYALNYNALDDQTSGIKGYSFELVDASTVRNLAKSDKTLLPYKYVDGRKDERWNTKRVNAEVMQGIVQGDSIPNIAKRLRNSIPEMNLESAIRNARTTVTSAENKGRMDSYHDAQEMGIVMKKVWMATHDGRTRPEHSELDGAEEDVDKPFINGFGEIMYPGDTDADPANVYNCRCCLVSDIKGFRSATTGKINYFSWAMDKHKVVEGKDISGSWERRADKFDFEIDDVLEAQGFNGLPKVVSAEEFDEAVKAANNGNGFIAQRTYSATDQETLDAYRNQLYYGDWYVDCSVGGKVFGSGMYGAYDFGTNVTKDIEKEMRDYGLITRARLGWGSVTNVETFTLDSSAKIIDFDKLEELFKKDNKGIKDIGAFAALNGYDCITTYWEDIRPHPECVILNRTKLIIKEP